MSETTETVSKTKSSILKTLKKELAQRAEIRKINIALHKEILTGLKDQCIIGEKTFFDVHAHKLQYGTSFEKSLIVLGYGSIGVGVVAVGTALAPILTATVASAILTVKSI